MGEEVKGQMKKRIMLERTRNTQYASRDTLHNLHIHSFFSRCASREMTIERIIIEAEKAGLEMIGISDHIDRPDAKERQNRLLDNFLIREKLNPSINVRIGCETSQIDPNTIALDEGIARQLDFVLVSSNHYHLSIVENPSEKTPWEYAAHYLRMVEGAIDWGHATSISHPFLLAKVRDIDHAQVLASYDRNELHRILRKAAGKGVAFELNPRHLRYAKDFFKELVDFGTRVGLKFTLGTDAHKPHEIAYSSADMEILSLLTPSPINPLPHV